MKPNRVRVLHYSKCIAICVQLTTCSGYLLGHLQPSTFTDKVLDCLTISYSDAVTRPVLVEPEGFERETINSSFICSTADSEYPSVLNFGRNWVDNTA